MTDDPHRDPTRTEDVEEALEALEQLRGMVRDDAELLGDPDGYEETICDALCDLRSRLEEVEGRLSGCESTLSRTRDALQVPEGRAISRYADRLHRRADRLEEALQRIVDEDLPVEGDGMTQDVLIAAQQVARRALDSREDEGEGDPYGGDEKCPTVGCDSGWGHEGDCNVSTESVRREPEEDYCGAPHPKYPAVCGPAEGHDGQHRAETTGLEWGADTDEPEGDEMSDFDEHAEYEPGDRYGELSAESLDEYREVLDRMEGIRGLLVYKGGSWFRSKAEEAEEAGHGWAAHALRQAAFIADERVHLRRLIRDAPTDEPVSREGAKIVAVCSNDECEDDHEYELDDGAVIDPAGCGHCGHPYAIHLRPATHADARSKGISYGERMAHLGILLTNAASALDAGRTGEAMKTLQHARDQHVDLLDRLSDAPSGEGERGG